MNSEDVARIGDGECDSHAHEGDDEAPGNVPWCPPEARLSR